MRNASLVLAVALLIPLAPAVARAGDKPDPEVKAVLDTQVAAILKADSPAFLGTFRPDAAVFVSDTYDLIDTPQALKEMFAAMFVERMDAPQKIKLNTVNAQALGSDVAVLSAELLWTAVVEGDDHWKVEYHLRVTEVLTRPADESGPWQVQAAMFSLPRDDKQVFAAASEGYDNPWTALPGGVAPDPKWVGDWFADGAKWVAYPMPWTAVFGSAPKEKALGKKAVALVKGWKKLKFEIAGNVRAGEVSGTYWMLANVNATFMVKKKPLVVRFRLMLVMLEEGETGDRFVITAHFAAI